MTRAWTRSCTAYSNTGGPNTVPGDLPACRVHVIKHDSTWSGHIEMWVESHLVIKHYLQVPCSPGCRSQWCRSQMNSDVTFDWQVFRDYKSSVFARLSCRWCFIQAEMSGRQAKTWAETVGSSGWNYTKLNIICIAMVEVMCLYDQSQCNEPTPVIS